LFVKKKDQLLHMCVDYRGHNMKLNQFSNELFCTRNGVVSKKI
jgi:hypothetical protein